MKKFFSYIAYLIVAGLWYLLSLLPFCVLYVFSDLLYLLAGRLVHYRHRVIWKNLRESFPRKASGSCGRWSMPSTVSSATI